MRGARNWTPASRLSKLCVAGPTARYLERDRWAIIKSIGESRILDQVDLPSPGALSHRERLAWWGPGCGPEPRREHDAVCVPLVSVASMPLVPADINFRTHMALGKAPYN